MSTSPTPAEEPVVTPAQSLAWAQLLERLLRGLESGSRQWTIGRRKDSVNRLLAANRGDMNRLRQRLEPLVASWESDRGRAPAGAPGAAEEAPAEPGIGVEVAGFPAETTAAREHPEVAGLTPGPSSVRTHGVASVERDEAGLHFATGPAVHGGSAASVSAAEWPPLVSSLESTVRAALPREEPRAAELADELASLSMRIGREGATPEVARDVEAVCVRARRLLSHRQHLVDELSKLCADLTGGLAELSEDDSWARGQATALRERLADGMSVRSVRAASEILADVRQRQQQVRSERDAARDTLRALIPRMLAELMALEEQTGRFEGSMGRHAQSLERADTLEGLASLVAVMVEETRAVQRAVGDTRSRLQHETRRAAELQTRVQDLEAELRRLSEEVSTDALTRVANRRGLEAAFANERARLEREHAPLTVGLIDIDNFKKLNDTLGHAAGDVALKSLAAKVRDGLRPVDTVARFGGEEFVVLLPGIPAEEGQVVLTRLQRALSASLFLHDNREVFVTFSAGVTAYRGGEALQTALERADEALYEAKRTGKNRTCLA